MLQVREAGMMLVYCTVRNCKLRICVHMLTKLSIFVITGNYKGGGLGTRLEYFNDFHKWILTGAHW